MHIRISTKTGFAAKMFVLAWVLNFLWELAQKPLYVVGSFPPFPLGWLRAATWDAGYILVLYLLLAVLHGDFYWLRRKNVWDLVFIFFSGFTAAAVVERQALALGKWFYADTMPLIPFLGVGLTPFIQLPLMSFAVYWLMRRLFSGYFE
jgi:hypothetical protein